MTYEPGTHVVCIVDFQSLDAAKQRSVKYGENYPKKGTVYTVRTTFEKSIHLEEIVNKPAQYLETFGEVRFGKDYFKPLKKLSVGDIVSEGISKEVTESA